ncbi:uncharacterized protein AB675_11658 [Cyphellophora attinorum]|uniref:Uncharacterized protein n=1 Tax=Cyphellophora attinorum TaxID=1664694 RepID=A0A0N0NI73_9EURO|nr:uncharacterized protein AB675_11658 [Phialophora attinorum]KPI35408.1 hypothetical protein AB675_11658 [Phialophora attinorum]
MGAYYEKIPPSLLAWILTQHMFYVATAPLSSQGHINVSPKGGPYFGLTSPSQFWYQELTGSGNETISHLHEPNNARICIMFNAYEGAPKIVRLWGTGRVLENGSREFKEFVEARNREVENKAELAKHKIDLIPGTRSIIVVDIDQVGSSCGFSVPFYDFKGYRDVLNNFFENKDKKFKETGDAKESMDQYWAFKNAWSMDGLPGMKRATWAAKEYDVAPIKKIVGPLGEKLAYSKGAVGERRQFSLEQMILAVLVALVLGAFAATRGAEVVDHVQQLLAKNGNETAANVQAWSQSFSK